MERTYFRDLPRTEKILQILTLIFSSIAMILLFIRIFADDNLILFVALIDCQVLSLFGMARLLWHRQWKNTAIFLTIAGIGMLCLLFVYMLVIYPATH